MSKSIFRYLFGEDYKLPLLNDAYTIGVDEYIDIYVDSYTLKYYITYPSGLSKELATAKELDTELLLTVKDPEQVEHIIRYATNWRHTAYYPATNMQYIVFPDGRIGRGGYGNHQ